MKPPNRRLQSLILALKMLRMSAGNGDGADRQEHEDAVLSGVGGGGVDDGRPFLVVISEILRTRKGGGGGALEALLHVDNALRLVCD